MSEQLSPKDYGFHSGTRIERINSKTIAIVINRKSRIIMADGKKILEKIVTLQEHHPEADIILKTNAPLCSKTRVYLEGKDIRVVEFS